ncbi:hypothetical protein Vretimale_10704 [Volvox reticuliferus]|uniref:Uncharacterized protein n=1 Tax=Volvox reticuliferus TaxID=1737510 RepID=A0A8J4GF54_9CHLO|nr:hypothetical protein Vretimale_10704 [Volvox reticuliferus]
MRIERSPVAIMHPLFSFCPLNCCLPALQPEEHERVSQQMQQLQMQTQQIQQQQVQQHQAPGFATVETTASRSSWAPQPTDAEEVSAQPVELAAGAGRQLDAGRQEAATGWGLTLHNLSPQQQQLLMLLQQQQQQQPRQVSQVQHQFPDGSVNDVAAAAAGLPPSRTQQHQVANEFLKQAQHPRQNQGESQLEHEFHAQQLQQYQRFQQAPGIEGIRSDVVDLTGDDDAEGTDAGAGTSAGAKRRLPASFLQGVQAVKRPATSQVPEPQLPLSDGAGGVQGPFVDPTAPLRRRLPPSLATAGGGGGVGGGGGGRNNSMLSQPQSLQQRSQPPPQQQQEEEDPRKPSAQEQQLLLYLDTVKTRLREGTMPASGSSSDTRPITTEERARLDEAALKLVRQIAAMQQERRQLLLAKQQQSQQQPQVWGPPGAAHQQHQHQLGWRPGYGLPSITTGMSVDRADRYRSQGNGISPSHGSLVSAAVLGPSTGASGSNGAASASASAAGRSLPASIANLKVEPAQSRVTEHQQALQAVIESLQVSGNEELEPPPKSLQVTVLRHQRMALAWMIRRETGPEPRGGILADDQGLGKTVTTISLIVTHTNPEERNQHCAGRQQQQQQGPVEVVELDEDDDDEEDVEDLGVEDEGEEDVDACGVRMGALRAEREAAGAAGVADVEGAAADMLREEGGGGSTAAAAAVQPTPGASASIAAGSDAAKPHIAVEEGGTAASTADIVTRTGDCDPSRAASFLNDDDDDDQDDDGTPVRPHKIIMIAPGGTGGVPDDPDILSITDNPSTRTSIGAGVGVGVGTNAVAASPSSILSLPPTAAGSLSELASSNLAASAATSTAALLASHGRQLAMQTAGVHRGGGGGTCKALYEPEPPYLLLGGTLVVCPTSVLHQWAREIREKVSPTAGLVVHVYHGKDRASSARQLAAMGVVLTTYGTLAQEAPSRDKQAVRLGRQGTSNTPINLAADDSGGEESGALAARGKGGGRPRSKGPTDPAGGPLYQIKWRRVVLDEAQSIKNSRTLAAHAAWRLFAHCRWCLSGTPIQNTVDDLYSYFRFLRYAPYCESRKFKELIKGKISEKPEIGYKFLQAVLQTVLLRRTKQSKINGEPIIKLPAREQQLLKVKFSAPEAAFYRQVQAESLRAIKEASQGGVSGSRQYVNMLHSLLKLRQACNHPWLVRGAKTNTWHRTGTPSAAEVEAARKLSPEARSALVTALSRGDAQCPCCGDIAEDPVASSCGHVFCGQCLAGQKEGASVEGELLCPACSRPLKGSDLHSAAALAAVDPAAALARAGSSAAGGPGSDAAGGGSDWVTSSKVERLLSLLEGIRAKDKDSTGGKAGSSGPLPAKSKSDKRMAGALRKLPPLPSGSAGASTSYGGGPGGRPDKVIVFSQWTSMLDLLEIPIKKAKIHFRRLDGTMTVANRERAIQDFESKPEVMVLLVSLKAAALGVNLTVANHVVLMDLWWNPTTEEQAIDRAHRIGQTRTVHVTRITIAGSVEDRILELQQVKKELVAAALSEGRDGNAAAGRLTLDDLRFLFEGLSQ